ncbi:MAG: cell envelope integrity protein TolA [Gammaproteobacteria bacterium]|jgi:colicin import membrane protein
MGSYVRDHLGAVSLSVLLHVAIVMALVFSVSFGRARIVRSPEPSAIEIVMVNEVPVAAVAPPPEPDVAEQQRLEQARLEREREQRRLQEQERLEQVRLERERQQREAAERDAEAQRAEQARLALEQRQLEEAERAAAEQAERERREAEEAARREAERLAEERRLEQERLAEERRREEARLAEERRREEERREQEARERALMEAELQRQLAAEEELMAARRSGEFDRYLRQIQVAIEQAWIPPASARDGLECTVNVTQIPSGDVIGVSIGTCNGDDAVRRSIEAAVLRASPLPTPSIPALFNRNLEVVFIPRF